MLSAEQIQGAVFDVDDTIVSTVDLEDPTNGLYERSRLAAVHETGELMGLPELLAITPQQNMDAHIASPIHTMEGAIWTLLLGAKLVAGDMDPGHELLKHIAARQDELFIPTLREFGQEVPGASRFIASLGRLGIQDRMAIASSGPRSNIMTILDILALRAYFPDKRIISKESVTNHKPHPEPFDKGFRTLDLPDNDRSRVLAIEDMPRGVASAKRAGLFTCALTTWRSADEFLRADVRPDVIASGFEELAAKLGITLIPEPADLPGSPPSFGKT